MFVTYTERVGDAESTLSMSGDPEEVIEFYLAITQPEDIAVEDTKNSLTYKVNIDTTDAVNNIDKLTNKIKEVIRLEQRAGGMLNNS